MELISITQLPTKCMGYVGEASLRRLVAGPWKFQYCSEKCQREHWPFHQKNCLECQYQRAILRKRAAELQIGAEARKKDTER